MYISCYQCVLVKFWCLRVVWFFFRCILRVLSVMECFGVFGGKLKCCECILSLFCVF